MTRVEQTDGVTTVTMSHGKASALDLEFCQHLTHVFEQLGGEPEPVVLTGTGHIFSAGVDLLRMLKEGADYTRAFLDALSGALLGLMRFPRPLVAAVNGHAIAGGCVVACGADHRIMARGKGRIGIPELRVGVPFHYLPDDALACGLVDEIVEPDQLHGAAADVARRYGELDAEAFRLTKAQVRKVALDRIETNTRAFGPDILDAWTQPDTLDRIRAYVETTFKKS